MRVKKINNISYTSDAGKNYDFNMADKNVERLSCGLRVFILLPQILHQLPCNTFHFFIQSIYFLGNLFLGIFFIGKIKFFYQTT